MISISTWNIQCGLGCDGRVDLERIAVVLRNLGDADVICLQEVARFMPDLDQGAADDQVMVLARLFPDHEPIFGPAMNLAGQGAGQRRQFGNLILSRLPVIQSFAYPLPQLADPAARHMPRQMTEVVIRHGDRSLRILTTHLEYHSKAQRCEQVAAIRHLHRQICANARNPGIDPGTGLYAISARPKSLIVCGDFNFSATSPEYNQMLSPIDENTPPLIDAWTGHHEQKLHAPTCGIYDHKTWPEGPHCRDFFFVSNDVSDCIVDIRVDLTTNASDHQPLRLSLNW